MFAIAFAWVKTGLARRFALWMIAKAGTDATRAVYVFMVGTGLISMIVSDVPAAAIFMAIAVGILEQLELRPGSRFGRAVMIPPMVVLGAAAGVNPALYALPVIFTASCAFLLPLDAVPLVTYSRGYYRMFDMFLPGLVISAAWVILMTALLIVIGPMVGLL